MNELHLPTARLVDRETDVMRIEDIEGGVRVRETSDDPSLTQLIRQHAIRGVGECVAEGHARARTATPLPAKYDEKPGGPGTH